MGPNTEPALEVYVAEFGDDATGKTRAVVIKSCRDGVRVVIPVGVEAARDIANALYGQAEILEAMLATLEDA